MQNKIIVPMKGGLAKKIQLANQLKDLRKILDRIETEVSGQELTPIYHTLIQRVIKTATGNLEAVLGFKQTSDQDKRK